jgi:hypothetical protein
MVLRHVSLVYLLHQTVNGTDSTLEYMMSGACGLLQTRPVFLPPPESLMLVVLIR